MGSQITNVLSTASTGTKGARPVATPRKAINI